MKTPVEMIALLAAAGVLLLSPGCKSGPTNAQGFDFSRYHTFALLPLPTQGTYQDPTIALRLGPPGRQAIVETLSAKGFQQVPQAEADFLVNLLFDYQPEQERTETRRLDIQIIDRKSGEVVWSTWWHRTTDAALPPDQFRKAVAQKLKAFPPASR